MPKSVVSRKEFLEDRLGIKFSDVVNDPEQPFECVLAFFGDADRQQRMEESELHHDRAPLAGVVRELESQPEIDQFLTGIHSRRSTRLRQATGVLVRMIMERRGWRKTGKKGSLGVRAAQVKGTPRHNTGGLAFWFVRAERYECATGMPFRSVRERCQEYELSPLDSENGKSSKPKRSKPKRSKTASSKTASSKISSSKISSSKTAGSKTAGSKTAGSKTAGSKTAGSKISSSKTAGSKTAGSKTAGSKTAGSKTAGSKTKNTRPKRASQ